MNVLKVKTVMALLEERGWKHVRTNGSHKIFKKEGEPRSIPIPGGLNDELATGTLKSILRQAKISESDLE